jgi:hypothetical protein
MTAVAFVVMTLAVARVTRLITTDDITTTLRRKLARANRPGDPTLMARFIYCDWCVGVWIALAAAVVGRLSHLVPTWSWAGWAWLGMAGGSGLLLGWQG